MQINQRTCQLCGDPLRKIGAERKNGRLIKNHNGKDWDTRETHKKCLEKYQLYQQYQKKETDALQKELDEYLKR